MKKMIRFSFIAIAAMISFSSCKDDDDDVVTKTKTEYLTAGKWKLVSAQEKMGTDPWEETINTYGACELDNYLAFNANQTVEFNEGPTKCDPQDPQSETSQWMFMNSETKLHLDGEEFTLDELSESTLIVTITEVFLGVPYSNKFTFKH